MKDKLSSYRLMRILCFFVYFSLGYFLSLSFMNQTAGSAVPMSIFFSWGSFLFFLLPYLGRIIKLDFLFIYSIVFFLFIGALELIYLISLVVINSRLARKNKGFPIFTVAYHFLGVVVAYFFRIKYEESGNIYIAYPVLAAIVILYIYLDWRLARGLIRQKNKLS